MKKNILLICLNIIALSSLPVYAHPHVFIDYKMTVIFSDDTFKSVKMDWNMDDMTSTNFVEEFDTNKNGNLEANEINAMKSTTFNNLKKSDYFTSINIDDKKISIPKIKDFKITYSDNLLKYSFIMDFNLKATNKLKKVQIDLIDKTNFVAFSPIDQRVGFKKSEKIAYINIEPKSVEDQIVLFKFNEKK